MRALVIITSLALAALLSACGGGSDDEQDSRQPPDKTIGPVQCAASAPACTTELATR